eukprot:GHVU01171667.1.p1 GENE.GHVU01171667.1~~GHVU01171667.1.p1  ORF type:complete len:175 (-),score=8.98 GHVU01171667.1:22-546(-)
MLQVLQVECYQRVGCLLNEQHQLVTLHRHTARSFRPFIKKKAAPVLLGAPNVAALGGRPWLCCFAGPSRRGAASSPGRANIVQAGCRYTVNYSAILVEANRRGTLPEALPADVDVVLSNEASSVGADAAHSAPFPKFPRMSVHQVRHFESAEEIRSRAATIRYSLSNIYGAPTP